MPKHSNPNAVYWVTFDRVERQMLEEAVKVAGTAKGAASLLGINEVFLRRRLKALGIAFPRQRLNWKAAGNARKREKLNGEPTA